MFLKNYTSDVPVSQTIYRIEQVLIRCGVSGIMKEYVGTDGQIAAINFQLETPSGKVFIRLPADVDKAWDALWRDYMGDDLLPDGKIAWGCQKKKSKASFKEQAGRTAWKIIQDWVEVQMSMIQLKQAETLQVFLPYVMMSKDESYYDRLKVNGYAGLLPEKAS
jgi:hypothetical protein